MATVFLLLLLVFPAFFSTISAVDFVFNGFSPSDLILLRNATVASTTSTDSSNTHRYLSLTEATAFAAGRVFHKTKIKTRTTEGNSTLALPFSTSFLFSIAPIPGVNSGHGITLMFSPFAEIDTGIESQQIGLFNFTTNGDSSNGVFAIELDVFENAEFQDIDDNHVGIDLYSLTSKNSSPAGYWSNYSSSSTTSSFIPLKLNDGSNYQLWVDYDGGSQITVAMSPAGVAKPMRALVSLELDLSSVFRDEMYVGFSASTGALYENHWILGWSFSNHNFSIGNALVTSDLPNLLHKYVDNSMPTAVIAGITSAAVMIVIFFLVLWIWVLRRRRRRRRSRDMEYDDSSGEAEDWELEYWPHRIGYKKISLATNNFSDENLIGSGGNGKVYKGKLLAGSPVAVKVFTRNTGEDERDFLAEVSSLGRLTHRNLVGLKGWCRKQSGDVMLVYEFMENGSLDKKIFSSSPPLNWTSRVQILKDVAAGVLYLHDGWECKVLHRDIKASNVMLDGDMIGRLGDFGLARIQGHDKSLRTTQVIGTVGYMAPEFVLTGKSTSATDVYGFGVLILEVVCNRRPVDDDGFPRLIDWAWEMVEKGDVADVVDNRTKRSGGYDAMEAGRLVRLGLVCTCGEAAKRPTMRKVMRALEGRMSDENAEEEGSSLEVYLVEKLKTVALVGRRGMSSRLSTAARYGRDKRNPTFDELRQSWPLSAGLSASDLILEGR